MECERVLQNAEKYDELVQLYQNKENHKKGREGRGLCMCVRGK